MTDYQKKLLRAKVALALLHELGRRPTEQEVDHFSLTARVLYTAILGLHYERKAQKAEDQLSIF